MTTITIPKRAKKLISYLQSNDGIESSTFTDNNGNPDLSGARYYAERLRVIHKDYLDELITIEQSFNKVTIELVP
jgi:hypothetical protein